MSDRVEKYRKRARTCLAQSGLAAGPDTRADFLKLAKGWQDLSNQIAQELGLPLEDLPQLELGSGWRAE